MTMPGLFPRFPATMLNAQRLGMHIYTWNSPWLLLLFSCSDFPLCTAPLTAPFTAAVSILSKSEAAASSAVMCMYLQYHRKYRLKDGLSRKSDIPVRNAHESNSANNVPETSGDHGLPDVIAHA